MDCIIIEDQAPAQRILKKYIQDMDSLHLKESFTDAIQALEFLKIESVDLIFLDIHLPKISGIEFLKSLSNPPQIILTTAFQDYALEGYELDVVDYLLKPFSFQRFVKAVSKVRMKNRNQVEQSKTEFKKPVREIFIKSGYEHIKIHVADILYITADSDYTEIYLSDKKFLASEALHYWQELLDDSLFTRVHKSFIVNVSKIVKIVGNQIYLPENIKVPIGRVYKDGFMDRYVK